MLGQQLHIISGGLPVGRIVCELIFIHNAVTQNSSGNCRTGMGWGPCEEGEQDKDQSYASGITHEKYPLWKEPRLNRKRMLPMRY